MSGNRHPLFGFIDVIFYQSVKIVLYMRNLDNMRIYIDSRVKGAIIKLTYEQIFICSNQKVNLIYQIRRIIL